jgi:hypothetical protein
MGIGMGFSVFTVTGAIFTAANGGDFHLENLLFVKMALGAMLVGIAYSVPASVYESDKLPMPIKILLHMGIGTAVMIPVALYLGWIPSGLGWPVLLAAIAAEVAVALLIWLCFWAYYKGEARRINMKINRQ